jgi:hypothetical protein
MQLAQFVDLLRLSKIFPNSQVDELIDTFESERREIASDNDGITQFCDLLVAKNAATEWQCSKLRLGRWRGFYLDEYFLLLEQDGKGTDYSSYRSRDIRDGSVVRLIITPTTLTQGLKYRVERFPA